MGCGGVRRPVEQARSGGTGPMPRSPIRGCWLCTCQRGRGPVRQGMKGRIPQLRNDAATADGGASRVDAASMGVGVESVEPFPAGGDEAEDDGSTAPSATSAANTSMPAEGDRHVFTAMTSSLSASCPSSTSPALNQPLGLLAPDDPSKKSIFQTCYLTLVTVKTRSSKSSSGSKSLHL